MQKRKLNLGLVAEFWRRNFNRETSHLEKNTDARRVETIPVREDLYECENQKNPYAWRSWYVSTISSNARTIEAYEWDPEGSAEKPAHKVNEFYLPSAGAPTHGAFAWFGHLPATRQEFIVERDWNNTEYHRTNPIFRGFAYESKSLC